MSDNIKLINCPFCNSDKVTVYKWNMSEFWSISCRNESCPIDHVLENLFETKEDAIHFWQHRYGKKYNSEEYQHLELKDN